MRILQVGDVGGRLSGGAEARRRGRADSGLTKLAIVHGKHWRYDTMP